MGRNFARKFCTLIFFVHVGYAEEPFVTSELFGQLGNQCFTIAATLAHAWENNATPYFPDLSEKDRFNIPINHEKVFWRLNDSAPKGSVSFHYQEPHFNFAKIPYVPNMSMTGYFQSERYFKKYKERIINLLLPSNEIVDYLKSRYEEIIYHDKSVAIHLRTYFRDDPLHLEYPMPSMDYFQKAVKFFDEDSLFVVFSDDISYCKKKMGNLAKNIIFIEGEAHYHDFYLMSMCKHQIISNSTFSWWSGYLNRNPKKIVIAPKKWMEKGANLNTVDVIPDDWVKLEYQ